MIVKSQHFKNAYYVAWSCSNTLCLHQLTDHWGTVDKWNCVRSTFTTHCHREEVRMVSCVPPTPHGVTLEKGEHWDCRQLGSNKAAPSFPIRCLNKHSTIFWTVWPWSLIQTSHIFVALKASCENYAYFSSPIIWHQGISYAYLEVRWHLHFSFVGEEGDSFY